MKKMRTREGTIQVPAQRSENSEKRVTVSFMSEEPCENWGGREIMIADESAADLSRYKGGICPVLFNHDRDKIVGRMENVKFENGKGYADVVFDDDEFSQGIYKKVESGSLRGVSVGYLRDVVVDVKEGQTYRDKYKGPCEVVTRWELLEFSIVSIPADPTVGVGREMEFEGEEKREAVTDGKEEPKEPEKEPTEPKEPTEAPAPEPTGTENNNRAEGEEKMPEKNQIDPKLAEEAAAKARASEQERIRSIINLCRTHKIEQKDEDALISDGKSVDEARSFILEKIAEREKPIKANVKRDEADTFKELVTKAVAERYDIAEKHSDDREVLKMASLPFKQIVRELISREVGEHDRHEIRFENDEQIFKRAMYSPSLSGVMDEFAHMTMEKAYKEQPFTFRQLVKKGSNSDFKTAYRYQLGLDGEPVRMSEESGEFTYDDVQDARKATKIATYGKGIRFDREIFINDQLGEVRDILANQSAGYGRLQEKQFYKLLTQASNFGTDNTATNTGVTKAAWSEMKRMMMMQKSFDKKGFVGVPPRFIVAPTAIEADIATMLNSTSDPTAPNSGAANIYNHAFALVTSPYLDAINEKAYYMMADPNVLACIEYTTLNGVDRPTARTIVATEFIGFEFQTYMDWGFNLLSTQGMVKNNG